MSTYRYNSIARTQLNCKRVQFSEDDAGHTQILNGRDILHV